MALRGRALCVALVVPLFVGCAVGAGLLEPFAGLMPEPMPDVEVSVNAYNNDLRWGRLRQASAQLAPEQREKFFELFDESSSGFRFTSVEVLSTEPRPRERVVGDGEVEPVVPSEYDVLVAFEYYRLPALDERKLRQKQTWRYLALENRWEVEPDFTGFEAALAPEHRESVDPVPAAPER
jgi:hypothetical protein